MKIPIHNADDSPQDEGGHHATPEEHSGSSAPTAEPDLGAPAEEPASPAERAQALAAALAEKTQEFDATREQLLRLMADFDNYRKRMNRQYEEARQFAVADLVVALLPGFDNLERALSAARHNATSTNAAIVEGVNMVLRQFKEALAKVGVREVQTQGQPFDPTRHEAVDTMRVPASSDGLVVEEVQRGYLLNERLLRPAKVVVGKADGDAGQGGA
jgi:molecular chaperone GrpE